MADRQPRGIGERLQGHLKAIVYAVIFGMGAYGVIRLMIWISKSLGSAV